MAQTLFATDLDQVPLSREPPLKSVCSCCPEQAIYSAREKNCHCGRTHTFTEDDCWVVFRHRIFLFFFAVNLGFGFATFGSGVDWCLRLSFYATEKWAWGNVQLPCSSRQPGGVILNSPNQTFTARKASI